MHINPIPKFNYNINNIHFCSTSRSYINENDKEIGNNTWLFRYDLEWMKFSQYLIDKFKDKNKVNIIQFASSDGSEGYTLIISLLENKKKKDVSKFFPIVAYDIDKYITSKAQSGKIGLSQKDIAQLKAHSIIRSKYFKRNKHTLNMYRNKLNYKYLRTYPDEILGPLEYFKVKENLKKNIYFNNNDMFKILPTIEDKSNTVILCRNILGYFDNNKVRNFTEELSKVLKSGSLFVIGNLDTQTTDIDNFLNEQDFKKVMKNVYMKL